MQYETKCYMICLDALQTTSNLEKYKKQTLDSRFVSKYEGRRNGGIPCFSEERSIERAAKVWVYCIQYWGVQKFGTKVSISIHLSSLFHFHCIDKINNLEIEFLYFYLDIIIHYFIISMAKGGVFMTEIKSNCQIDVPVTCLGLFQWVYWFMI